MALLIGLVSAFVLFVGVVVLLLRRGHRRHAGHLSATPMVFMPMDGEAQVEVRPPPLPVVGVPPVERPAARPQLMHELDASHPEARVVEQQPHVEPLAAAGGVASVHPHAHAGGGAAHLMDTPTLMVPRRRTPARPRTTTDGAAMGTLRMLPGRLVPEDRSIVRDDIRFVAQDGSDDHRYTLGRAEGDPRDHVRLSSPTVSRQHALLAYSGHEWTIRNLSDTNPVQVNGEDITGRAAVPLADGDQVEIGELVFRFRG